MKKALIIGVSGQDGSYLSQLLISKGYEVHGTSRDVELCPFYGLKKLNIFDKVAKHSLSLVDFRSVMQVIFEVKPDEIYNLAGQSSVSLSFSQPVETYESISIGTLNILEVLRFNKLPTRFYNACSSECFGETNHQGADESTPFQPKSPYAVSKAAAFWQVVNYRTAYKIFASSGILFNHESPLRPNRFVTKKIIDAACRIYKGEREAKLRIGDVTIRRDWGWAPEYVEAMYLILQHNEPEDFVIATGKEISLQGFIEKVFSYFALDYRSYIEHDPNLFRPADIRFSVGNPTKAKEILGWRAEYRVEDVIKMMIENELNSPEK